MNENLEEVRRDIEVTRNALGEKIEKLENKIETTKNTTLNPAYHLRTHPWPILAGVTVLSCLIGRSLRSRPSQNGAKISASGASVIRTSLVSSLASALSSSLAFAAGEYIRGCLKARKDGGRNGEPFGGDSLGR